MFQIVQLNKLIKFENNINIGDLYRIESIEISKLKIYSVKIGIVGRLHSNSPSKIVIPNITQIYGYSLWSEHSGIYMEYVSYVDGNTIYAYCKDNYTSGHSTRIFIIGV